MTYIHLNEVMDELGVSKRKVLSLINQVNMTVKRNEQKYYLFTEEQVTQLKDALQNVHKKKPVHSSTYTNHEIPNEFVSSFENKYDERLLHTNHSLQHLEQRVDTHDYELERLHTEVKQQRVARIHEQDDPSPLVRQLLKRLEEQDQTLRVLRNEVESKANDVVSFQLLTHRREIDELRERIVDLESLLQQKETEHEERVQSIESRTDTPRVRKGLFKAIFGN